MTSTNGNSGSDGGYQSKEMQAMEQSTDLKLSGLKRLSPASGPNASNASSRYKKDDSILHPSSPSKIKFDSISPKRGNNFNSSLSALKNRVTDSSSGGESNEGTKRLT